jgi:hypothetical protein|tara:strand:+ start:693 stop:848 length:156 start_codon:yes stop_codon:yes gene_type:complete
MISNMNWFHVLLIILILLLALMWAEESKWMERNWPEIEMDFFWSDGQLQVE